MKPFFTWMGGKRLLSKVILDIFPAKVDRYVEVFGVKALLNVSKNVRNALMFNLLYYMSDSLLTKGNTLTSIDDLYLFLGNLTMVEYIRNFMKYEKNNY